MPTTIKQVIYPNVNNHGIYALLELGLITQIELGTRYAIVPLMNLDLANKTHIEEDLKLARGFALKDESTLGLIHLNQQI